MTAIALAPAPAEPGPVDDEPRTLAEVEGAEAVGIPSVLGLAKGVLSAVARPGPATREALHLTADLARILRGTDSIAPSPKDKRFADPAWSKNPAYRRLGQGYLSLTGSLARLVDDYEAAGADWHAVEQARFGVNALSSLLAPTNTLPGNPAALKQAFDTGGASVLRGLGHLLHDLRHNRGMPSQTDRSAFTVGVDLAVTPGAVVDRDAVAELLQYSAVTPTVKQRPLLVVPPPIGRYYFLDLRPGRSFVEYAVSQGFTVFMLSWRNPTREQSEWDLDTYAQRILDAVDAVKEITGSPDINTLGFCAGGILSATVLNHLAEQGDDSVHSAGFAVTLLDFQSRAPLGAFSSPRLLELARSDSRRKGVITAQSLGAVFSWMRPDDLIFNYVVNQWLMGEDPPVFDILAWNADGTNLPARLHEQFLGVFRDNTLVTGDLTVLGSKVDLAQVTVPTFVTGAVNDHLTPWNGCYRTTRLLSGPSTFMLSNAGHIASLVNPPGNPRASYHVGGPSGADAEQWREGSERRTGSWWEGWSEWLAGHSGDERPAPDSLGSPAHPPLEAAPGGYVVDRVG
ncbi:MAG TPA: alpha/beta fold hydrolase [Mycobacteriales bacterium]|jgi:polyhydroxyalkanoate synthase|nr:alpha/beta fold hydrolase [Mycobacteriales bacterium]